MNALLLRINPRLESVRDTMDSFTVPTTRFASNSPSDSWMNGGGYANFYLLSAEPLNRMIRPARSARHTSSSVRSIRFIPDKTLLLSESGTMHLVRHDRCCGQCAHLQHPSSNYTPCLFERTPWKDNISIQMAGLNNVETVSENASSSHKNTSKQTTSDRLDAGK